MRYQTRFIKRFAILALIFHLPILLVLLHVTAAFIPALFWINIPVLWTGIASAMGESHFKVAEFGATPQSPLAYTVIVVFWLLLAAWIAWLSVRKYKR